MLGPLDREGRDIEPPPRLGAVRILGIERDGAEREGAERTLGALNASAMGCSSTKAHGSANGSRCTHSSFASCSIRD
ncbi:MAG: hypothetical protein R2748_01405 [Bryobacterales bacterium]